MMGFKFEKLEVWNMSLQYIDIIYDIALKLPPFEDFNLKSQSMRAATSVALNIAEGSTGQTDPEQRRFVGVSIRSLMECVACLHIMKRRKYIDNKEFESAYNYSEKFFAKLQAFRNSLGKKDKR